MKKTTTSFAGIHGNRLDAEIFEVDGASHVALLLHGGGQTRHSWRKPPRVSL